MNGRGNVISTRRFTAPNRYDVLLHIDRVLREISDTARQLFVSLLKDLLYSLTFEMASV